MPFPQQCFLVCAGLYTHLFEYIYARIRIAYDFTTVLTKGHMRSEYNMI
jgi:hypothetical protein